MIKIYLLLFFLSFSLFARENPFFPLNSELDIPLTINQLKIPPLKRATITLPSTARTLQSVTVKYKNLDGTIAEKSIELENSIDWHLPLFISQNYELNEAQKTNVKSLTEKKKKVGFKKVAGLQFIKFYVAGKVMKIVTKDKMLRNFMLVQPHRIVCDFKRNTDLGSVMRTISGNEAYTQINIGTHKGYYRVVIELDGHYQYKIERVKYGYKLTLR